MRAAILCGLFFFLFIPISRAEVIVLINGDRLSGVATQKPDDSGIILHHPVLGRLDIRRTDILSISNATAEQPAPAPKPGKKEREKGDLEVKKRLGLNYQMTSGNSDTMLLNGEALYNRNRTWIDEITMSFDMANHYSNDKKDVQTYKGELRYGKSFTKSFYGFARLGAEHDYFENLNLRLTPTAGPGYWILDREREKLLIETGAGYEVEYFRGGDRRAKPILHLRAHAEKKIYDRTELSSDVYFFPTLNDFADNRLEAEIALRYAVTKNFGIKVKVSDQRRSRPPQDKKKNDLTLLSGIEYSFG